MRVIVNLFRNDNVPAWWIWNHRTGPLAGALCGVLLGYLAWIPHMFMIAIALFLLLICLNIMSCVYDW